RRCRDQLPPGGVGGGAPAHVLLGAGLNQRVVTDGAGRVEAAAADSNPVGGRLVLPGRVLRGRGHGPVARDRVEHLASLLERPLVVTKPVVALCCLEACARLCDVQQAAVGARGRLGGRRETHQQAAAREGCYENTRASELRLHVLLLWRLGRARVRRVISSLPARGYLPVRARCEAAAPHTEAAAN